MPMKVGDDRDAEVHDARKIYGGRLRPGTFSRTREDGRQSLESGARRRIKRSMAGRQEFDDNKYK